jgi:hypothetical protein
MLSSALLKVKHALDHKVSELPEELKLTAVIFAAKIMR